MSPKILQYPNFKKEFSITADARQKACDAVLYQQYDGKYLLVCYALKSFTKEESNKSTIEQELTAIHCAIHHFKSYVYGKHFTIKTDHRPLVHLFSMKDLTSKLIRMLLDLEEYDFTVEYVKGKNNYVADALSKLYTNFSKTLGIHESLQVCDCKYYFYSPFKKIGDMKKVCHNYGKKPSI